MELLPVSVDDALQASGLAPAAEGTAGLWLPLFPAAQVEILLLYWGESQPFELQLLARVLEEGVRRGGRERLVWRWVRPPLDPSPGTSQLWVVAQDAAAGPPEAAALRLTELGSANVFIGPGALWFARTPAARGTRVAMHWEDAQATEQAADEVVPSPAIVEAHGRWTTCSGGMAVIDLGLMLLQEFAGSRVALQAMEALCIDRIREPVARQRTATSDALRVMVPKLAEAVALMEANIEEPLQTDEIARLVGVSRRQLERLFKQHLNTVPSRYSLEIRLRTARKLLRESQHSLLQVGLMCGFSSGSHFSTSYSTVFGLTPREERQRHLSSLRK